MIPKNEQEKASPSRSKKKKDSTFWEDIAINVAIIAATSFVGGMASAAGSTVFSRVTNRGRGFSPDETLPHNVIDIRGAV